MVARRAGGGAASSLIYPAAPAHQTDRSTFCDCCESTRREVAAPHEMRPRLSAAWRGRLPQQVGVHYPTLALPGCGADALDGIGGVAQLPR
jgi:hypothetical protein